MKKIVFKNKAFVKGQLMIEVAIALGIAALIISGLLVSVLTSLDNAQFSKNLNQATQYSQEGMEAIRAMNGNFLGDYCLPEPVSPNPPRLQSDSEGCTNNANIGGFFRRKVEIQLPGNCTNGLKQVTIRTAWTDGKCTGSQGFCHKSELNSCLGNL